MERRPIFKKFSNKRIDLNSIYGYSVVINNRYDNPYILNFYPIYKYENKNANIISIYYTEKEKNVWEEDVKFLDDFFNIDSISL